MTLNDLAPYFELYKTLKERGKDLVLNEELLQKEKEFAGKKIALRAIVSEIDILKNELIATYTPHHNADNILSLQKLIANHYFIFASSPDLLQFIQQHPIGKDDLVEITGIITTIHRHSVLRITLSTVLLIKKNNGILY